MAAQADPPAPSTTVNEMVWILLQADAAAAVAGDDGLVLVVGPAGAGKTRMLSAAVDDLHAAAVGAVRRWRRRPRRPARSSATPASWPTRSPSCSTMASAPTGHHCRSSQLPAGATLVVDEAGMLGTPALHQLVILADRHRWRLALVGDPRQLQGVGRGGLFAELCANGRVEELERSTASATRGKPPLRCSCVPATRARLDAYEAHGRIVAGTLEDHLDRIASTWIDHHRQGRSIGVVASRTTTSTHWVNNYLMGENPPAFDILYWNNDTTRLPAGLHSDFLDLYLTNGLVEGTLDVLGTTVDLRNVTCDTFVVAGHTDHLIPWDAAYRTTQVMGGDSTFVLSNGGHIQAILNPPDNPKAAYLVAETLPPTAQELA